MPTINAIKEFIAADKADNGDFKYALAIATTSADFREQYFSFPRLINNWGYYFHLVCKNTAQADAAVRDLKPYFHEFFLDAESKNYEFDASDISKKHSDISFSSIYPNELTIKACADTLDTLSYADIQIFGHGNLAFDFASLLRCRGTDFSWCPSRISDSGKYLRMASAFSACESDSLASAGGTIFNFSPNSSETLSLALEKAQVDVIDVASKGALGNYQSNRVSSLDISARLVNEVSFLLVGNEYTGTLGRLTNKEGIGFVSGGFPGSYGDFVVDNYRNPSFIIGVSDGKGGFLRRINENFKVYEESKNNKKGSV